MTEKQLKVKKNSSRTVFYFSYTNKFLNKLFFAYGLNSDTNYLEVEYSADLFSSYSRVFDLEW